MNKTRPNSIPKEVLDQNNKAPKLTPPGWKENGVNNVVEPVEPDYSANEQNKESHKTRSLLKALSHLIRLFSSSGSFPFPVIF